MGGARNFDGCILLSIPNLFCQEVVVAAWRGPSSHEIAVHDLVHKVDKFQDT